MSLKNTVTTYGSVAKFFHWLIFFLLTFMIILGYFLERIPSDYKALANTTHKLTGLVILFLMVLRLGWALIQPKPALPLNTPCWERWAERCMHVALYAVVIAMPLAGWIGSSAAGKAPRLGRIDFNLPITQSKSVSHTVFGVHNTLAIVIIVLVSLHVLAAFYHHFIRKDGVLLGMMVHRRHR